VTRSVSNVLALCVLCLTMLGMAACVGNVDGVCDSGETCVCDGIGNCDWDCPDGDCNFVCNGIGNCNLTCDGGGCSATCNGDGNCILDCAGDDCTQYCDGTGNCIIESCLTASIFSSGSFSSRAMRISAAALFCTRNDWSTASRTSRSGSEE